MRVRDLAQQKINESLGQNTATFSELKVDVDHVWALQDNIWGVVDRLVAKKEQDEIADHQSILNHPTPFDHEDDEEDKLPKLDKPLWDPTPIEQRDDSRPAGKTKPTSNKPELYRKLLGTLDDTKSV